MTTIAGGAYCAVRRPASRSPPTENAWRQVEKLKLLMDKAEKGAGGTVVNAIAYKGDYIAAQDELKVIDATARDKKCNPEGCAGCPRIALISLITFVALRPRRSGSPFSPTSPFSPLTSLEHPARESPASRAAVID